MIDNDAFRDFWSLVKSAIIQFEAERIRDRQPLKEATGQIRPEVTDKAVFTRNLAALSKMVMDQASIDGETKYQISKLISEAREALESILTEKEQPLLVAGFFRHYIYDAHP